MTDDQQHRDHGRHEWHERIRAAAHRTYGPKSVRHPQAGVSPVLNVVSWLMRVLNFFFLGNIVRMAYRYAKNPNDNLPPALIDAYVLISAVIAGVILSWTGQRPAVVGTERNDRPSFLRF
jgi:hypothetical protein